MLYTFNHNNYSNFNVFEDNKVEPRAYFIPFRDKENMNQTTYLDERYKSRMITNLNGKWDFKYFSKISDMPKEIDTWDYEFDTIQVPSCWEFQGYQQPFYINSRYQFDCKPPYIPNCEGWYGYDASIQNGKLPVKVFNSAGVYRKKFKMVRSKKHILTFLGVSSSIQLYFNGHYIGYSEGSHNSAEFDVTHYVLDGVNEIVAVVYRWCNGTYLECQDMFRNSGIFRDVYLTNYEDNYIWDYSIKTFVIDENHSMLSVDVDAVKEEDTKLEYQLYFGKDLVETVKDAECCDFTIEKPHLWSAETPNLYTLYIYMKKNNKTIFCVRQEVGFKTISIEKSIFYFNDKPIILKGVNHHDTDAETGYTMTIDKLYKDVDLMKQLNINAVRTSHYPPDPVFIKIANHLGLYVIDEADIETHGCYGKTIGRPNLISNDLKWKNHFWDRVLRMVKRDRNNPSITMWSLGNESGGWKCQDYCYDNLKKIDSTIPVHYEGVSRNKRWAYDVVSQMYTSTETLEKIRDHKMPAKYYKAPYFLCEYAHSMGVGPGSLDIYMKLFEDIPTAMGGCIWEWADHAVKTSDGNYLYGGDHGEYAHDYNFCADGMVYPDRRLSTSAYNARCVYRPVRASYVSNNKYSLYNTNFFAATNNILYKWEYTQNGEVLSSGEFKATIPPKGSYVVTLKHPLLDTSKDCFMNFYYYDIEKNVEIAREQISLCQSIDRLSPVKAANVACIEENGKIIIATNDGQIVFDKSTAKMISYNINDYEYIDQHEDSEVFIPKITKPLIDNYMNLAKKWSKDGLDNPRLEVRSFDCNKLNNCVEVVIVYRIYLKEKIRFICTNVFNIYGNGCMDIKSTLDIAKPYDLTRFGLTLEMPKSFNKVCYYARGDKENYSDFNTHAIISINECNVSEMYDNYIMPQDNGNRSEARWLKVYDENGYGLNFIANENALNINVTNYRDESVSKAKHIKELVSDERTIVRLDHWVRGIGSNSCGPDAREEYRRCSAETMEYQFRVEPIKINRK